MFKYTITLELKTAEREVFLADKLKYLTTEHYDLLVHQDIIDFIFENSGKMTIPEITEREV